MSWKSPGKLSLKEWTPCFNYIPSFFHLSLKSQVNIILAPAHTFLSELCFTPHYYMLNIFKDITDITFI